MLYACRDITERRRAEEELRTARLDLVHASRLTLLGELVASITHEISQPLTSIVSNSAAGLRLLADNAGPDERSAILEIFSDIRDQGRVAVDVIERIRTLVSKRPLEVQLDVNEIATDMLRLVETEARRRGVTLKTDLASDLPKVQADRVGLQQVVLNLILNAMDEMDRHEITDRQLTVRTSQVEAFIEVAVSDTGRGIPDDRLPKIFDAFFTTKVEGIGLGLAIARSIIEGHGGRIWAENDVRAQSFDLRCPRLVLPDRHLPTERGMNACSSMFNCHCSLGKRRSRPLNDT